MARVDITQSDVLDRIVVRLREQLDLDPRQCFESLDADSPPELPVGGDYFVGVSPGDGQFLTGEQVVGNVTELWSVVVTAYTRVHLDSANHDTAVLRDTSRGLLELKRKILKALVGEDLTTGDGDTFLRQLLYATDSRKPQIGTWQGGSRPRSDMSFGWVSVTFGVDFDWDIT